MRDLLLWSYMCNCCLNRPIPTQNLINCTYDELLACLLHCKRYVTVDEWNNGIPYSITNYSNSHDTVPWIACWKGGSAFGILSRYSRCIYCKWNCFILCVFYTVDLFDISCIHCDRMAQEVLVLGIVKVFSFVYTYHFLFFLRLICQSDCTVCLESGVRSNPVPIPLSGSKTVWVRMIMLYFQL